MEKFRKILQSKLAQNGMWLIILQGFNMIIPLLTLPYITRILSQSAYGEFSLALNWIGYFQVIVEYGFGLTGARKVAMRKSNKEASTIHSNIIFARLLLMLGCLMLFIIIIIFVPIEKTQIMCMAILFLMIVSITFQQTWFFQGISEMKNITIINVISRAISVFLIFILVKTPDDLYLYCFLYISNFLISSMVGYIVVKKKYQVKLHFCGLKAVILELKEGWYLFVSSAMTKIFSSIGITILGFFSTTEKVGIYAAINKIPYVLMLLFSAISQALYPYMCKKFSESYKNGLKSIKKIGIPVLGCFIAGGLIIMFFNNLIVKIAFGLDYAQDSTLLVPFVIWVLAGIINNFLGIQTLVASGHQKEYSKSFQISVIVMFVLMFTFGYFWSSYGIAFASMCSEILLTCLLYRNVKKLEKTNRF